MKLQVLVPVHTYPEGNADAIALHAAAVARHLDADIDALIFAVDFPRVSSPLGNMLVDVPAMIGEAKAKCRARGAALVQMLESETGSHGIPFRTTELECTTTEFGDTVAIHARYHDLVVVGLGPDDPLPRATAEAAIFGSGRPVLLVPERRSAGEFNHVMIAWDGSRVAARAVADAREFLHRAQAVTIVSVVDEKALPAEDPAGRLAQYLSRRDIQASAVHLQGGDRPIAQVLQEHAREVGADILVMGAFGHSRVRNFVLGGATKGILEDLQLSVLLSH